MDYLYKFKDIVENTIKEYESKKQELKKLKKVNSSLNKSNKELEAQITKLKKDIDVYLQVIESYKNQGGSAVETPAEEVKAFPTAKGAGAYATGGRGGEIVHVTNLNDSGTGSLREALQMTVPRMIVFDVSGVIYLNSVLGLTSANSNVTIAGQTAPEGGITIAGNRVYFDGVSNLISRHIRYKGGKDISNDSVLSVGDIKDQIFDHCSFGFGTDEGASWYSGTSSDSDKYNFTVQNCLFNENVKGAIVGKQEYDVNAPVEITFYNNVFYNSSYRFPNVSVGTQGGRVDVVNNVAWNITDRLLRVNGEVELNHIGNYYNYGTRGITDVRTNMLYYNESYSPKIYTNNNIIDGGVESNPLTFTVSEMNADNKKSWGFFQDTKEVVAGSFEIGEDYEIKEVGTTDFTLIGASSNSVGVIFTATGTGSGTGTAWDYYYGDRLTDVYFTETQFDLLGEQFTLLTGNEILSSLISNVGCNARLNADGSVSDNKDTIDADSLNQIALGNYIAKLDKTSYDVTPITSVSRPASFYVSNAHIPEAWFSANVPSGKTHNDIAPSGYTYFEEYINQVDK